MTRMWESLSIGLWTDGEQIDRLGLSTCCLHGIHRMSIAQSDRRQTLNR